VKKANWDLVIKPKRSLFEIDLKSVWQYRDLLRMFVYRDFVTYYKQTVLGPLWFFIQPVFIAAVNLFVFGRLAGLGPEGVSGFLFYMSGPILWQYFQDTFTKTSSTFIENQAIFGKVFFPRLIMPLTVLISGLLKFGVQLCLLLLAILYYYITTGSFSINWEILFFPVVLIIVMILSMGFGLLVSSLTTKYRDLKFLIDFGIPLLKYITPGIATSFALFVDKLPSKLVPFAKLNPMGYLIDTFNYMFVGAGEFAWMNLLYPFVFALVILFAGVIIFNQTERNFMDTV
jgi:lipopolysaccharide transport system permease protein